ncbi:MAG: TetR family transcriptional regulator [Oligoflexales bacterium]
MKISKEDKLKTRAAIVDAAVAIIESKGYKAATMKDISQKAGIADATIYKYFATKESIFFGYLDLRTDDLVDKLKAIKDFQNYTLKEQLHAVLDTFFQQTKNEKKFLKLAYDYMFTNICLSIDSEAKMAKKKFTAIFADLLDAAIEAEEIPDIPFRSFVVELFWEYLVGVTYYWINDDSKNSDATTQLIDKSLDVTVALLQSRIMSTAFDLGKYLVREHLLSKIFNPSKKAQSIAKIKRSLFGGDE